MFESLKKKFSRTSEKLEEELIEEAEKEDNLQEESGKRFSFFSFGRKKEEKKEEEDESNLIPETTQEQKTVNTGDMDVAQVFMMAICSIAGAVLAVKQKAIN